MCSSDLYAGKSDQLRNPRCSGTALFPGVGNPAGLVCGTDGMDGELSDFVLLVPHGALEKEQARIKIRL